MTKLTKFALAFALTMGLVAPAMAADLRIGLAEDPDLLDPDQARTFVGRIVFTSLCDKLVDITPKLEIIPQLATDWSWSDDGTVLTMDLRQGVTFHDGTPFNAEAVLANIDRSQHLPESRRQSELTSVQSAAATGEYQVTFTLASADATLLAQFADRAGMMMSPKALTEEGVDFSNNPVCSGPFKFVERIQQDRIVLEKFPEYWNADKFAFDTITYLPIPDSTVRLANVRSGDLDMLERLAATDAKSVKDDTGLTYAEAVSLGYSGITINLENGDAGDNPFGNEKLLRQAFSFAIDRDAINQVVFNGAFAPGNQPYPPTSPWYNTSIPVPARDIEKAKALMSEAGFESVDLTLTVPNSPETLQLAQVIQSMVSEAGFNVTINATEFATMLSQQTAGNYEADQVGWSGRVDPDGNIHQFVTCEGGINDTGYCNPEVDKLLNAARTTTDTAARKTAYDAALAILNEDLPILYIYHQSWIWALNKGVTGFVPYPDGMIRLEGVSKS